jgi:hypothetical protein
MLNNNNNKEIFIKIIINKTIIRTNNCKIMKFINKIKKVIYIKDYKVMLII